MILGEYLNIRQLYWITASTINVIAMILIIACFYQYKKHYQNLNTIFKCYFMVLLADCVGIVNHLPNNLISLSHNAIQTEGGNCHASAFLSVVQVLGSYASIVLVAYCTYCLCHGKQISDEMIVGYTIIGWLIAIMCACYFHFIDSLGPFKGIYCCITMEKYHNVNVIAPFFFAVVIEGIVIGVFYYQSYKMVKNKGLLLERMGKKNRLANQIFRRGLIFTYVFWQSWLLMFLNVILEFYMGKSVSLESDMFAAFFAKSAGIVNALLCLKMFRNWDNYNRTKNLSMFKSHNTNNTNNKHNLSHQKSFMSNDILISIKNPNFSFMKNSKETIQPKLSQQPMVLENVNNNSINMINNKNNSNNKGIKIFDNDLDFESKEPN